MSFSEKLQDVAGELFINVVAEKSPEVADGLRRKLHLIGDAVSASSNSHHFKLDGLRDLHEDIKRDPTFALEVAEYDAKLVDVLWRARKTAGIIAVNAVARAGDIRTGDTFVEVLERLCRKNLSPSFVQYLVGFAKVWPSLTTHPTNPTSFRYTRAGHKVDEIMADPTGSRTQLIGALRDLRDTPMDSDEILVDNKDGIGKHKQVVPKKTPQLEMQEVLMVLNVIYDSVAGPHARLRQALDRFGYHSVKTDDAILNVCAWGAGDGDGNPNMNHVVLHDQVFLFRRNVRDRYLKDMHHHTIDRLHGYKYRAFLDLREDVISKLSKWQHWENDDVQPLLQDIKALRRTLHEALATGVLDAAQDENQSNFTAEREAETHLEALEIKVKTFGLHMAHIDVRHNSVDIMEATASLLEAVQALPNGVTGKMFAENLTVAEQSAAILAVFNDEAKVKSCRDLTDDEVTSKLSEVGSRVFLRLRVIARFPLCFEKLIIAETRSAANGLAALLLLRCANNIVAAPGARISVVPLFESREDLDAAPGIFHTLATENTFRKHLESIGYFIAMIAKSDTTRLSGAGVQGKQEETVARLMSMDPKSYGNGFRMKIFVGGGDDQMRGGGRIVETPHVLMLAAHRLGARHAAHFAMTIQGLQMQLVFGSQLLSEHFIEAFAAQQMLAAARLLGWIHYRPTSIKCNPLAAASWARDFFRDAMIAYESLVGSPNSSSKDLAARRQTIVDYYARFPASIITSGNKSSRPMARKKSVDPLQGRAISLDQLSKHDGAYVTATLGIAQALTAMNQTVRYGSPERCDDQLSQNEPQPMSPIRHGYMVNKSFRDFVRMQAVVLFQKDFSIAWRYRGGVPTGPERLMLLKEYHMSVKQQKPASPRAFLAFIEDQDHCEAGLLVEAITGNPAPVFGGYPFAVALSQPLECGWPDLASKMRHRAAHCGFSQLVVEEAVLGLQPGANPGNTELLQQLGYYGYVGVNPRFSTPSFSLTMTDPQKEGTAKPSETRPSVQRHLRAPLWAAARDSKL